MGARVDMAVLRRDRALALGVMDSIAYVSGRVPTSTKPRVLATIGGYVLALLALAGTLAVLARMAH